MNPTTSLRSLAPLWALLLLLPLAACGDATDDTDSGDAAGVSMADLEGRTFLTDEVEDPSHTVVPGTQIRISFDEGRVAANAGCNSMSGAATIEGGRLVVPQLATTEMACDPARMDQDSWLAAVLGDRPTVDLADQTLTLTTDTTTLRLKEERVEPAALEGTAWRLDTLYSGTGPDGTASSVPAGAEKAGLSINDGRLSVATGCNRGSAPVTYDDTTLTVGPLALTKMACDQPLAAVEQTFLLVLDGTPTYRIEGSTLTITAADESAALGFHAG